MTQRQRRLGLLLGLAVLAVGLMVWWPAAPHQPVALAAPRPATQVREIVASQPLQTTPTAPSAAPAADPLDVCAQPQLAEQSFESLMESPLWPGIGALWQQQSQSLRLAVMNRLLSSGRDDERVAGLMLKGDAEEVARLAASTEDPTAYAMALKACRSPFFGLPLAAVASAAAAVASGAALPAKPAACATLSVERWAQLAPRNATPWLELASAAQQRGDTSGVVNSLYQAGRAETLDSGWGRLTGMVASQLPDGVPEGGQMLLTVEVIGQESAMVDARVGIMKLCDARSIADSNRRQQCEQLAKTMMSRGNDMLDVSLGVGLAERLGLPASERAVTREQLREAQALSASVFTGASGRQGVCDTIRSANRWWLDVGRLGEWPAMKALVAAERNR